MQPKFPNFLSLLPVPDETDPALDLPDLLWFPSVRGAVRSTHGKAIGAAGEHLTQSLLMRHGLAAFMADDSQPYDIAVLGPFGPWTVQVKTATLPTNGVYSFNMEHGYRNSPRGRRLYAAGAFDMTALVILPLNVVFFTRARAEQHRIREAEAVAEMRYPSRSLLLAFGEMLGDPPPDWHLRDAEALARHYHAELAERMPWMRPRRGAPAAPVAPEPRSKSPIVPRPSGRLPAHPRSKASGPAKVLSFKACMALIGEDDPPPAPWEIEEDLRKFAAKS
jgi:hypothetical protein